MNGMTVAAVLVIAAFLAAMLRRSHPEQAMGLTLMAGIAALAAVLGYVLPLLKDLRDMLQQSGLSGEYIQILFKALGVCVITQLAADACRDAGEQSLAAKAELAGKWMLLTLSLPLFQKVGSIALSLIEKGVS
ncbi:MAG: stage III sporulation protein AD [Clostridia bacterium]|nr:stage III sporulation protein AD [Clostridia bacterium]